MKTPLSPKAFEKTFSNHNSENNRKRKSYYEQFLQMLIRKTDAEKRAHVFGMDPFK
jgi:hypothetical protein